MQHNLISPKRRNLVYNLHIPSLSIHFVTIMELTKLAVEFNNGAVARAEKEFYVDAITLFQGSMHILLYSCVSADKDPSIQRANFLLRRSQRQEQEHNHVSTRSLVATNAAAKLSEREFSFVYDQLFPIQNYPKNIEEWTQLEKRKITIIVVYNAAVTHHLCGSNAAVKSAATLYEMVYNLVVGLRGHCDKRSLLIAMACLNNMVQINHDAGKFNLARKFLGRLQQALSQFNNNATNEQSDQKMDQGASEHFAATLLLYREPKTAAAA